MVAATDPTATRASIATFHLPNVDAVIAPMDRFVDATGTHHQPVTPFVWEEMFLARTRRPPAARR
ncbi:hypothetical protein [Frankia sp. AgB32]|uniref:hypothetical protein n=1 Tax=Frankia sp. AgB32 TaxID=631119 RepID=UPI00200C7380|nr:hypothetical protein [Frankia sp. AgB32]MCK9894321.1 hypothetical protein [Frankia sp. AgB32]